MRWLILGLIGCGVESEDTGQPRGGLVEVFEVDCDFQPGGDGRVRIAELLDGPVAIVQLENCDPDMLECSRFNGGLGDAKVYSDVDGSIWLDPTDCKNFAITRAFVVR